MIDLTPLDVRKKKGDFRKAMRGYDPGDVDPFLDLAAERLEELVKANRDLSEEVGRLRRQVEAQEGRERAVQEALVSAQELRREIQEQSRREAELVLREAEAGAEQLRQEMEDRIHQREEQARRALERLRGDLEELERSRGRFLRGFRRFLQDELEALALEEGRQGELIPTLEDEGGPDSTLDDAFPLHPQPEEVPADDPRPEEPEEAVPGKPQPEEDPSPVRGPD